MPPQRDNVNHRIVELACRQHGLVTREQLRTLGLSAAAIKHRLATGVLFRVHRGVYAVGRPDISPDGRRLAAAWSYGAAAVLSHRSAGAVWGIAAEGVAVDVTVPTSAGVRPRHGVRLHRHRGLHAGERTSYGVVPVTTVPRTLLDLAAVLSPPALRRAVERAEQLELFDLHALRPLLSRHAGRPGWPALVRLLDDYRQHGMTVTRSTLEAAFLQICLDNGLPRPRVNRAALGREVGFRWPDHRLVVETDGFEHHRTRAAFRTDRRRDREALAAGYRVARFTYDEVLDEPAMVARTLAVLLAA